MSHNVIELWIQQYSTVTRQMVTLFKTFSIAMTLLLYTKYIFSWNHFMSTLWIIYIDVSVEVSGNYAVSNESVFKQLLNTSFETFSIARLHVYPLLITLYKMILPWNPLMSTLWFIYIEVYVYISVLKLYHMKWIRL